MSKLAILKIGDGSLEQGFPVTLQICEERESAGQLALLPLAEITAQLPAAPELWAAYEQWQSRYRQLGLRSRLNAPQQQNTNISVTQDCNQAAETLSNQLNQWLRAEPFRPVREKWLEQLSSSSVRVILQTEQPQLQRLPWHLWEILDRHTQAELALSISSFERVARPMTETSGQVRILAILGNSTGVDVQADRALLAALPQAEVCLLVEPERQDLTEQLWSQPWDMLFFAGHSASLDYHLGEIQINPTERLTIPQLKYGLKTAIAQGLKLAIFNSCDGLGLARNLADLHLPQLIVMREPVPDRVAQAFLKSFLDSFSNGQPLYAAVRSAREQLQGLEDRFPCASWLPVICQNPAEPAVSWQMLVGQPDLPPVSLPDSPPEPLPSPILPQSWLKRLRRPAVIAPGLIKLALTRIALSAAIAAALVGLRATGQLQPAELKAFDGLMQLRPTEAPDERLLIVSIDQAERQQYGAEIPAVGRVSLSDQALSQVLRRLSGARVIGLDLYRDWAVNPPALAARSHPKQLISVCKARFAGGDSIAPPPAAPPEQVGFSDFVVDQDGSLRRQLLAMTPELIDSDSPCTAPYAFSLQLALHYLQVQQISHRFVEGDLQIGQTRFERLQTPFGAYQQADSRGNQILLNYRSGSSPAQQVTLTQLLSGQVNPAVIQDRIVLVGVISAAADDIWITPVSAQMAGVVAQAHQVSQLLSAVLDQRALLKANPELDGFVMVGAALIGCILGSQPHRGWWIAVSAAGLGLLCWGALVAGYWLPFLPAELALLVGGIWPSGIWPQPRLPAS